MNVRRAIIAVAIASALWAVVAPLLADLLIVEKQIDRPDAILVLGGGAAYIERTDFAAAQFAAGTAPRILLTNDGLQGGWDKTEQRNPYFWELAKRNLIARGVPAEAIVLLPEKVESTFDEAQLLSQKASELGLKSVLVVTSPHHTRRALRTFERAAGDRIMIGVAAPPSDLGPFWWLKRRGLNRVALEYVKLAYYSLFS